MKPSHFRTPRQRSECWEDTRLSVQQHKDGALAWLAAAGLVVAMVLILLYRG